MIPIILSLIYFCLLTPTSSSPEVVPWGIQQSIGISPFNPPWYDVRNSTKGLFDTDDYYTWPNNTVPYVLNTNPANFGGNITLLNQSIALALRAFQIIMNTTCVRFVPRTNEIDYLFLSLGAGCWSYVGYLHMPNQTMGDVCGTHELLHTLGIVHEQGRRDRDYYTAFNWTNLDPAYYEAYELKNWPTFGTAFDPRSIMMYMGWYGHRQDKFPVSIYKDGTDGNNGFVHDFKHFSEGDRQKVNRRYKCDNDDSCWDEDPLNCPVWAAAGACTNPNWVINTCPKLCCNDTKNPWGKLKICSQNLSNTRSDCGYIGATLGCTNNTANGGMARYCRQSCGFCKRPSNYKLNPMIITKCEKTCNPKCNQNNGCNLSLPPNNPDFDQTKPESQCKTLPAKNGITTAAWCASSKWAQYYCQTTCNIRETCNPLCIDQDPNCPNLAAKKGCYGLYN